MIDKSDSYDFIFGYGSILNDFSRLSTTGVGDSSIEIGLKETDTFFESGGNISGDTAVACYLSYKFGYCRSWSFRSPTGFTALGLKPSVCLSENNRDIFGVLFTVSETMLLHFDARELGYRRILLPIDYLRICFDKGSKIALERAEFYSNLFKSEDIITRVWVYIPNEFFEANQEYPILQTYIDICIRGCMRWGGESVALDFLLSTHSWTKYYLNDAPLSRRPWLHRLDYVLVDQCLEKVSGFVNYFDRLHPEDYAARHLTSLRGIWGTTARNQLFIGRESILDDLHKKLLDESTSSSNCTRKNITGSIRQAELVGSGGVGKSQLALEYCHKYFNITYGLIIWLRAESVASIAADFRRFAYDMGIVKKRRKFSITTEKDGGDADVEDEDDADDDETIIEEVKQRLSRCRCRWLAVFDNLEDPLIIQKFLPKGRSIGHCDVNVSVDFSMNQHSDKAWTALYNNNNDNNNNNNNNNNISTTYQPIRTNINADRPNYLLNIPFNEIANCKQENISMHEQQQQQSLSSSHLFEAAAASYGSGSGHILVTSRKTNREWDLRGSSILIDCFTSEESLHFLKMSLHGPTSSVSCSDLSASDNKEYQLLTSRLGNHPLALSIAAAYMSRCDVSTHEYISRLEYSLRNRNKRNNANDTTTTTTTTIVSKSATQKTDVGSSKTEESDISPITRENDSLLSSISISLSRVAGESIILSSLIPSLGYLASDHITRRIISLLILSSHYKTEGPFKTLFTSIDLPKINTDFKKDGRNLFRLSVVLFIFVLISSLIDVKLLVRNYEISFAYILGFIIFAYSLYCLVNRQITYRSDSRKIELDVLTNATGVSIDQSYDQPASINGGVHSNHSNREVRGQKVITIDENKLASEVDRVWELLKQFSLMIARGPRGSRVGCIHRLQQAVMRNYISYNIKPYSENVDSFYLIGQRTYSSLSPLSFANLVSLETCVWVFTKLWSFSPADTKTWDGCGELIEHIRVLSDHSKRAFQDLEGIELNYLCTTDFSVLPKVLLRYKYAKDLGQLLYEAATYSYMALSNFEFSESLLETSLEIFESLVLSTPELWHDAKTKRRVFNNLPRDNGFSALNLSLTNERAECYHTLGKILRFRGKLLQSEAFLLKALKFRQQFCPGSLSIADTLHELGIVYLRHQDCNTAEKYLRESLAIKKNLLSTNLISHRAESGESSTLHQLAAVAVLAKKYDQAEDLLNISLDIETSTSKSTSQVARAATLQQLGRVALRKGQLDVAKCKLLEALEMYRKTYGEQRSNRHVNVAAVHHQLGSTASARQDFSEAIQEHTIALSIRESISGESINEIHKSCHKSYERNHIEMIGELQCLAQAYLMKGDSYLIAYDLFSKEKNIISNILSGKLEIGSDSEEAKIKSKLLKSLLHSIYSLRTIDKILGYTDEFNLHSKEAQAIKRKYFSKYISENKTSANTMIIPTESVEEREIIDLLLSQRLLIRNLLISHRNQSTDIYEKLSDQIKSLQKDETLTKLLDLYLNFVSDEIYQIGIAHIGKLSAVSFTPYDLCSDAWEICDKLRFSLRKLGVNIKDG